MPDLLTGPETVPFSFEVAWLAAALLVVTLIERRAALTPEEGTLQRWVLGIGLWAISALVAGAVAPAVGGGPGLLARAGITAPAAQFLILLAAVDAVQMLVHRAMHRVPLLWRLHAIHHADARFDAATSLRFHPAETLVRVSVDIALLWALMPDTAVVSGVMVTLGIWNVFEHGRFELPPAIASALSAVFVTPAVHRVHHARPAEMHDTNFATVFTLWDRLGGTYRAPGQEVFDVGLDGWTAGDDLTANLIAPVGTQAGNTGR